MKTLRFFTSVLITHFLAWLCLVDLAYADPPVVKVIQLDSRGFPTVTAYVSVTDEEGQPISTFQQEDFNLQEDGHDFEILDFADTGSNRLVDIVFVFDTTGSMAEEIVSVKNPSIAFANKLRNSNRDFRLGLVAFGDEIRSIDQANGGLTPKAEEFKRWVGRLGVVGGDDDPELSLDALLTASNMQFRTDSQKILFLITDASPHEVNDGTSFSQVTPSETIKTLKDNGFTVYAIAINVDSFRKLTSATGGKFYDINKNSDFTGIIDKIGGLIANQYRITYRSQRPVFDGTRRPVTVFVGGGTDSNFYTEEHMFNVQSTPLAAAVLAAPLMLALALPLLRRKRKQPSQDFAAYVSAVKHCVYCYRALNANAKFCSECGQPTNAKTVANSYSSVCTICGKSPRPGAKFCGYCGNQIV